MREKVENARGSGLKPANERVRKGNEQTSSSVPKVRARTDVTSSTSLEASPATRAKISCAWGAKCEYRHVVIGTLPCVVITSLKADAFMAIIACFDTLMEKPRKRSKKESAKNGKSWAHQKCIPED